MSSDKRDRQRAEELQLLLQGVEPAQTTPSPPQPQVEGGLPIEFLMEQVLMHLESLPTAAQLALIRLTMPELLEQLDPDARMQLADELGLLNESFQ